MARRWSGLVVVEYQGWIDGSVAEIAVAGVCKRHRGGPGHPVAFVDMAKDVQARPDPLNRLSQVAAAHLFAFTVQAALPPRRAMRGQITGMDEYVAGRDLQALRLAVRVADQDEPHSGSTL